MLFLSPNAQKPKRIQGVYVDDSEIEKIVHFWTDDKFEEMIPDKQDHLIIEANIARQKNEDSKNQKTDDLYPNAIQLISELETVSVSLLQRKLRIGYPRAARLMDELEEVSSLNNLDNSDIKDITPETESNYTNNHDDSIIS